MSAWFDRLKAFAQGFRLRPRTTTEQAGGQAPRALIQSLELVEGAKDEAQALFEIFALYKG